MATPDPGSADGKAPGLLITGTGTEVGKTVLAGLIAAAAHARGLGPAVFKPAVTGLAELPDQVLPDHEFLIAASASDQAPDEAAPYRYEPACSPHLAAALAGERIEPALLVERAGALRLQSGLLVVEGVGGLMVPLTLGFLMRDLAVELGLPLVVAAHPGLGTLNHTLLTLEAARAAGLPVAGVVLTPWPDDPDPICRDNLGSLRALGGVTVATVPRLAPRILRSPTPEGLAPIAEESLPLDSWL